MEDQLSQRGERVAKIFKLVDACNRLGLAFRIASDHITSDDFRHYSDELRHMVDRFTFELLAEVHRIDGGDFGPPRSYEDGVAESEGQLRAHCEWALREAIDLYDETLADHLPAHARAMIKRQVQQLKEESGRFNEVYRASA
jgi:hypothetical protein